MSSIFNFYIVESFLKIAQLQVLLLLFFSKSIVLVYRTYLLWKIFPWTNSLCFIRWPGLEETVNKVSCLIQIVLDENNCSVYSLPFSIVCYQVSSQM